MIAYTDYRCTDKHSRKIHRPQQREMNEGKAPLKEMNERDDDDDNNEKVSQPKTYSSSVYFFLTRNSGNCAREKKRKNKKAESYSPFVFLFWSISLDFQRSLKKTLKYIFLPSFFT